MHEAIVLLDFSKNFSFVIQDEVQGYHWIKEACTLHTPITHTKIYDNLSVNNISILSNNMHHDVTFVYITQQEISSCFSFIKEKYPNVTKILCFSNGSKFSK